MSHNNKDAINIVVIPQPGGCVSITLKCEFVILNPSFVILNEVKNLVVHLRINSAKNLAVLLRINSVKNLIRSMCCKTEILRLGPQNDIATQPLDRGIQKAEDTADPLGSVPAIRSGNLRT